MKTKPGKPKRRDGGYNELKSDAPAISPIVAMQPLKAKSIPEMKHCLLKSSSATFIYITIKWLLRVPVFLKLMLVFT